MGFLLTTVAIILAFDDAPGFPGSKYLVDVGGEPLIRRAVADTAAWDVNERIVVLGPDADAIAEVIAGEDVTTVIDPEWAEGTAASLRAAIDFVTRDRSITNLVFARGDQPGVPASVVDELMAKAEQTGADAVFPKYRYARGWPVLVGGSVFERLLGSEGDVDLPAFLSTHAAMIEECWFDRLAPPTITGPDDLQGRHR
jgi:molybdenum cofactor cytidylyltransferase